MCARALLTANRLECIDDRLTIAGITGSGALLACVIASVFFWHRRRPRTNLEEISIDLNKLEQREEVR